jgi:hypothetical protein
MDSREQIERLLDRFDFSDQCTIEIVAQIIAIEVADGFEGIHRRRFRRDREPVDRVSRTTGVTMSTNSLGHDPHDAMIIEGVTIRRCLCGMILMLMPSKRIWWVKAVALPEEILSFDDLLRALASGCRYRRRPPDAQDAAPPVEAQPKKKPAPPLPPPPAPEPEPAPAAHVEPPLPPTLRRLQMRGRPVVQVKRRPKAKAE